MHVTSIAAKLQMVFSWKSPGFYVYLVLSELCNRVKQSLIRMYFTDKGERKDVVRVKLPVIVD